MKTGIRAQDESDARVADEVELGDPEDLRANTEGRISIGRPADVQQLTAAALFVTSLEASYLTWQEVHVSGLTSHRYFAPAASSVASGAQALSKTLEGTFWRA